MTEQQARILVVEDEPHMAAGVCARLEALGYEPLGPVGTAAEALRLAGIDRPDLVLMDVVLPGGMDGVTAAGEFLRQSIPVVYLTAHADDALLQRAKITEPLGYLVKPCTERELHAAVVTALYRHRVKRQLAEANKQLEQAQIELERKVEERTAYLAELNRRLVQEAVERAQIEQVLRESEQHLRLNEQRLIASEQKYRAIMENAVDAIFLCAMDGRILDANRRAGELLGYTKDEFCRMTAEDLHPVEEHDRLHEVFRQLANHGNTLVLHPVLRKDRQMIYCEVAATLIRFGDEWLAQGIFRDVTERERRSKERLAQEGLHRDTLVREVHHRIKNNLQGVVGLLREHASTHPELADVISTAISQVQSISLVHGLHGKGDDLQVRLCDMVEAIARSASTLTRAAVQPDVQLVVDRPVRVDKDEAVPVALIINELILNAVKHSGGGPDKARVLVRVTKADQTAVVCVMNPGRFPDGFDFAQSRGSGTGLGLVRSLLPHAGAELTFEQVSGEVRAWLRLSPPVVSV